MCMSNLLGAAATIKVIGRPFAPADDAKITLIDPREVAAVVLTDNGHEGRNYSLTGPSAVTYYDVAEHLAAAIARPVEYVDVPDPAVREAMIEAGLREWLTDQLIILWANCDRTPGRSRPMWCGCSPAASRAPSPSRPGLQLPPSADE